MLLLSDLCAGYSKDFVLRDVSVEIESNMFVGIIGKNGSGKSTFIKALVGLVPNLVGEIIFENRRVLKNNCRDIFSYVPQESLIPFGFTVNEVLRMSQRSYRGVLGRLSQKEIERIEWVISEFELMPLVGRNIMSLSGGERKRVLIGRGVAQDSRVVLLDEPLSGLDIDNQVKVFQSLLGIAHTGRLVIASVHDLNVAAQFCDKIILIDNGRLIKYGTVEEVLTYSNVRTYFGVDVYVGINEINHKRFLIPFR